MADIAFSMAQEQIKELRADNARLKAEHRRLQDDTWALEQKLRNDYFILKQDYDALRAEIERLTTKNADLRMQIDELAAIIRGEEDGREYAALEPKP